MVNPFNFIKSRLSRGAGTHPAENDSAARRASIRRSVVTVCAVTAAWMIGALFNGSDALVAAIVVLITLRVSLHASANEAIGQLAGVAVGTVVALGASETFGAGAFSVALIVCVALLISRALQLGDEGAANIAITSLIVLGPGAELDRAMDRLVGSLIGVGVAVVASYFVQNSTPTLRTVEGVARLHRESQQLLWKMSAALSGGYSIDDASSWLGQARHMVSTIPQLRSQAFEAVRYARWSPLARSSDAEAAQLRHLEAEHVAVQVRTISRTLYDIRDKNIVLPRPVAQVLATVMRGVSELVSISAEHVAKDAQYQLRRDETAMLRRQLADAGRKLVELEHPSAVTVTGALLSNIERIVDTLEGSSSALTEVPVISSEADIGERLVEAVTKPISIPRKQLLSRRQTRTRRRAAR